MITLTHPIIGDKTFKDVEANDIMAVENNGGWTIKSKDASIRRDKKYTKESNKEE